MGSSANKQEKQDALSYGRHSAWLVINQQNDKHNGADDGVTVKVKAFQPYLFERGVHMRR